MLARWSFILLMFLSGEISAAGFNCEESARQTQDIYKVASTTDQVIDAINRYAYRRVKKTKKEALHSVSLRGARQATRGWQFAGFKAEVKDKRLTSTTLKFVLPFD